MLARLKIFRRWLYGGDPELISLDRRIFLLLTFLSVMAALAGLAVNLFSHINIWATLSTAIAPSILFVLYLSVRKSQNYYRHFIPIVITLMMLIAFSWFTNAGYNGNILILIYITFSALYIAAKDKHRKYIYVIFLGFSTALIVIHYLFPVHIIGYDNDEQRFFDLALGNLLYMTFQFIVLSTLIKSYNRQTDNLISNSKQLKEREEKYRLLVEESSDPIFSYTPDGRYLYVNRAFADAVGKRVEDIVGKSLWDIFPKEEADRRFEAISQVFGAGETRVIEVSAPYDGRFYQTTITPIQNAAGEVIFAICTAKDVTERKRTEDALQASHRRLELFFNQSVYGYYCSAFDHPLEWNDRTDKDKVLEDIDQHQFITEINDEMLIQYGATRESLIGRPMSAFFEHDKENARRFRRDLFDKGRLHVETFELKDNNTPVWIEGDYVCTYDDLGRITGTFGIQLDVTNRKQAEKERERLQEQLTQTLKMESVGRLAGGVAHDFNNMLQAILGHVELVLQEVPEESAFRDNLLEIQACARRSADLTRHLLAFARKQTISPIALDLNDAVASSLKLLRRLIGEDIDLIWRPGPNLWLVKMDPSQLDQILANLCVNARDAISGVGKVIIKTENRFIERADLASDTSNSSGEYVTLVVSDNGCGMNPEVLSHLFEPFYTTKDVGKGTGLGLAMVYGVVQQNNGFIEVQSEPEKGSTFELNFPRRQAESSPTKEPSGAPRESGGNETILVVEDEPAILKLAEMILEAQGYTVLLASVPSEAIHLAETHPGAIQLLLTDVIMPEMNGGDLARILVSSYPNMRLMFMSGYTADVIAPHGVLDEGVFFIEKPFLVDDFCRKVREALDYRHGKEGIG